MADLPQFDFLDYIFIIRCIDKSQVMKIFRLVGLVSGVLVGQLVTPAWAAEEFSAAAPSSQEGSDVLFQDIPDVYSASKYEQKVTKAPPGSISVVTADEIKKWGYRTFGDVLQSLKGFYNTNDRNYGFAGARGFGIPSDYNTRLLLLIDGHRFNDNIFDAFDTSEGFPVDLNVIERIEVIRGPSSSLYGTNAFFGVINVITKRGRDQDGFNVNASYGTNDAYKTNVSYGERFKSGLETFVSGTFFNNDGWDSLYYKEFDSPATNNGRSVGNDAEQSRKLFAKASYEDFSFEGVFVRRNKDVPTSSFSTLFNNPNLQTINESTFVEGKYEHTFDNQLTVQSKLSYNHFRYQGSYPFDYNTFDYVTTPDSNIVVNKDLSYGEWWRADLQASRVFWDDHRITVGGQYQDNYHQHQTNYDSDTYLSSNPNTYQWAIFAEDDWTINKYFSLNVGVRLDYFSIFGDTVNPRAGLIYTPWENTAVKLLYGSAFRAPNQYELNYISSQYLPSKNLQPEHLDTYEIIVEQYFTPQLRGELNLFYSSIGDIIAATPVADGKLQQQNGASVDSKGIELQLENNWLNGWQARLSYSWQHTENASTQQRLTNSPEHMVKLNLIAPLWEDKVFLGFENHYMSARKTPVTVFHPSGGMVDDYVVSNVTIFTQNWIKGFEFSGGVYNLFDQRYFDPAASIKQNAIEQDSLTFRIKASLDF